MLEGGQPRPGWRRSALGAIHFASGSPYEYSRKSGLLGFQGLVGAGLIPKKWVWSGGWLAV